MATPEQKAGIAFWVDRYAAQAQQLKDNLSTGLARIWARFDGWYDDPLVDEMASEALDLLLTDINQIEALSDQYAAQILDIITDRGVTITPVTRVEMRNGADLTGVYRRPVEQYRHRVARGMDPDEANAKSFRRLENMAETDALIAQRNATVAQWNAETQVIGYRRVVRPELSESGSCGLCIVASDRIYHESDLMPIHDHCKCITLPVIGDEEDFAKGMNDIDLEEFYRAAGSNRAAELKRTRYQVNEHGELGALLNRKGDSFKGPRDVKPLEQDPERAARYLKDALPVLELLRKQGPSEALDYQENFVAKLQAAVA